MDWRGIFAIVALWAAPVAAADAVRVRVTARELATRPTTPMIYGNFIESGFGRQVDGMRAEMLYNRSFESIPPIRGWLQKRPGEELRRQPWWHSGYEEPAWRLEAGDSGATLRMSLHFGFHHGDQGARITNGSVAARAALVQDGLYLRAGATYRFRGFIKPVQRLDRQAAATLALYPEGQTGGGPLISRPWPIQPDGWSELAVDLPNQSFTGRASIAVSLPPATDLYLDDFSLMPADNLDGWRRDVVEALRKVRPSIIRFPGGCYASAFDWRDGIGPRDRRRPRESDYWGGLEYNDAGTDEFVRLCRLLGAEPMPVINMMTGSPEEAAAWVAYCNAPATHPMGHLRARYGNPEPYGIRYWELDNETYRKWSAAEYGRHIVEFSRAMRQVDPNVRLVAVGYGQFANSVREILEVAGAHIDFVSDRAKGERHLERQLAILREYGRRTGRDLRLCNTEWLAPWTEVDPDSWLPGGMLLRAQEKALTVQEMQIRWRYAMNAARTLLMFRRLGGDFAFANFNNMANTWGQNVVECPKEGAFLSAAGRVFELYASSPAAWALAVERQGAAEGIEAQAAWDRDRKRLVLDVLNYRDTATAVRFDLAALRLATRKAAVTRLSADSPMAYNSVANPAATRRAEETAAAGAGEFTVQAAPYSITQVVLE